MWSRKSVATLSALFAAGLMSLLGPSDAPAAPCVPAPLSDYILLSSSGCTVTDTLFFDFGYLQEGGEDVPPAASILVTPITTPGNPGLRFTSNFWIQPFPPEDPFNPNLRSLIDYTVQTQGALIKDNSLAMLAEASTEDAFVAVLESKCLEGFLGSGGEGCSSGNFLFLQLLATSETSGSLSDSRTFAPVSFIDVFTIIDVRAIVTAGDFGDAKLFEVSQQFSQVGVEVPEPATFLLMGMALVGLFAQRRLKSKVMKG